jgi:hypothetical protein
MKTYWGNGGILHAVLTSALDGGESSASRPDHFILGERAPGTHWIGGWVGPRAGLDRGCPCTLTEHHAIKAYCGVDVQLHAFLTSALDGGEWSASRPAALPPPPGKSPWYPLDRRLGRSQSSSGRGGEEKNSQPLPGVEP